MMAGKTVQPEMETWRTSPWPCIRSGLGLQALEKGGWTVLFTAGQMEGEGCGEQQPGDGLC